MSTYNRSFELPKVVTTNNEFKYTHLEQATQKILSVFDTDDKKGVLSKQELTEALRFLQKKEKEIAVGGIKGDGYIHEDDFKEIFKDKKFESIKYDDVKDKNNSNHFADDNIHDAFIALIGGFKGKLKSVCIGNHFYNSSTFEDEPLEVTRITRTKANNKDAYIYDSGSNIHLNNDKKQRYLDADFVAGKVGLHAHKTWFGFGSTDYYSREEYRDYRNYVYAHYDWDDNKHEFIKTEEKESRRHSKGTY